MKNITKWLVVLALVVLAVNAFAIPARPRPTTLTQPDGSKFTVLLKGDEHFSWAEDMDGYSIIQNKDGWWTFAGQENGLLVPTNLMVGRAACPYKPHLRPNAEAISKLPRNKHLQINVTDEQRDKWAKETLYGVGGTKEKPSKAPTGKKYCNVLLGNFSDSTFQIFSDKDPNPWTIFPKSIYQHMLTLIPGDADSLKPVVADSSKAPSMSNYYWECSYNKLWWGHYTWGDDQITGVDTIRASGKTWSGADGNTTGYMKAAADAANAAVDFRDPNDNAVQAGLIVVHPGPGEEESGRENDIWSASYSGLGWSLDGITVDKCIVCPQNGQLGVFAHEMFHQLGAPDLYDYGYSGEPWGEWTLMASGSWNGEPGGSQPSFPGGHLTYDINGDLGAVDGWLPAGASGKSDSISSAYLGDGEYTVACLDSVGEADRGNVTSGIRLWRIRNNAFRDSAQVFFVEVRNRTPPYEIGLPENGILITHIDTRMAGTAPNFNGGPPGKKYYYSWVENPGVNPNLNYAAGDSNFPRNPANAAYSADDVSSGGYIENAIDSLSVPNCKTNRGTGNGDGNGPWIYDVSREGPTMKFKVARTGKAAAVPVVGYVSSVVLDPVTANTANNNNSLFDPWETDSLKMTFRNTGVAITAGAQCSLYVAKGTQWASVTNPGWKQVGDGAIATDASGQCLPFVVTIKKDAPKFTDILFGVAFKSATPSYSTTSYFTQRISGLKVVKTYDFQNIRVGGTTWDWRIMPSSVAVLADTVFLSNANLDHSSWSTRVYAVKKNTTNNPLVAGDTIRSINNRGSVQQNGRYGGGIDIDNNGKLWISLADSVFRTNRSTTTEANFKAPNVAWGGTPMKRIRGISMGPSVIDTVGPDPLPGDSLWAYWQNYGTGDFTGANARCESLIVMSKPASGTAVKRYGYSWNDTAYGTPAEYPSWWNGRAVAYDGSSIWTTSVWKNYLIRRNAVDAKTIEVMPGPSSYGNYGTYGAAIEVTDSLGVPYAPVGTVAYVRGAVGTKHYLYCGSMDEGKIYKVDVTDLVLPTPPDSQKVTAISSTSNKIKWWKANVDEMKVSHYFVYRQADGVTTPPTQADTIGRRQHSFGGGAADSFVDNNAKGGKAAYTYSIKSVNYYGLGTWGASVKSSPLAVEVTSFASSVSGYSVTLQWSWASASAYQWRIKRSADDQNYEVRAALDGAGSSNTSGSLSYTDPVETEGTYYYQLYVVDTYDNEKLSGSLTVTVGKVPLNYELSQNYPNPMGRGATTVKFALKNPGKVSLAVYNVLGEQVRTLANDTRKAGFYSVNWNGTDDKGRQVSNGIYFYKLISGEFSSTKKMMVLK